MKTMTKATLFKSIILNRVDASGYEEGYLPMTVLEKSAFLRLVYNSEFGSLANKRYGSQEACREYLLGLPGCCTIPFYNQQILTVLSRYGFPASTEAQESALIEQYWRGMGLQFFNLISGKGLPKTEIKLNLEGSMNTKTESINK